MHGVMTPCYCHDMNTPRRTVRIEDELWTAATAKANEEGTTVTEVIRKALSAYVKAGAVVLVVMAALFVTAACGGAETPGTTPVEPTASQPVVAVTSEPVAEAKPMGEAFALDRSATLKATALGADEFAIELTSTGLYTLDGEFVGTDSAGVQHVGVSMVEQQHGKPLSANGYGGDRVSFGTTDIVSITYTGNGAVLTWTA